MRSLNINMLNKYCYFLLYHNKIVIKISDLPISDEYMFLN
jgi:hypothetical protein